MKTIEKNALRIAELMGHNEWRLNNIQDVLISRYTAYDYLMPIVFECNKSSNDITIDIDCNDVVLTQYNSNYKLVCTYGIYEEQTFIKTEIIVTGKQIGRAHV